MRLLLVLALAGSAGAWAQALTPALPAAPSADAGERVEPSPPQATNGDATSPERGERSAAAPTKGGAASVPSPDTDAGSSGALVEAVLRAQPADAPGPLPEPALPTTPPEAALAPAPPPPLRETTVRAASSPRAASEVTVPRDLVRAAPRSGAADLLRLAPGVVASQHSGEGKAHQLFLRGFDAVHGQDVELSVAGLPVNDVSHVHALGYADLNWLIPELVRAVSVTEGSYRAWQGDFAVAGSIRYELGLDKPGLRFAAGVGSFGRTRLFAGFRPAALRDTFAAAEVVQGNGFGPQRAFARSSLLAQTVLEVGRLTVRAVAGSASARFDSPGVVRADAFESGRAGFFDAFGAQQGGASSRHQLLVGVELPGEQERTSLELFGVLSKLRLRNNFTGFLGGSAGDGLEQLYDDAVVGVRALHRRCLLRDATQSLGLELGLTGRRDAAHLRQRGFRDLDAAPLHEDFEADVTQSALGGFGELAYTRGPWRAMVGARLDALAYEVLDALAYESDRTRLGRGSTRAAWGTHLGLKAGLERQLAGPLRLFLSYGDGFRSPQARSLADGERAPFVSVRGAETGARAEWARVSAQAALFGSWVANDVVFDHAAGTTLPAGPTLRVGGSLGLTARPSAGWVLAAHGTLANARLLKSGALLPGFAPLVVRADTGYSHTFAWREGLVSARVGGGLTVVGPRPLPYREFTAPVALVDALAEVQAGAIALRVEVQNALDARWRDGEFVFVSQWERSATTSRLPARHFSAGAPRTLMFTLEVHP